MSHRDVPHQPPEDASQPTPHTRREGASQSAPARSEPHHGSEHDHAARSVMHPESYDPEWRYYHGAWGG